MMLRHWALACLIATGLTDLATRAAAPFADSPFGAPVAATTAEDKTDTGNRLALVSGGYDALLLRVHLIRQARSSIDIQTFIWSNDECGRLLMHELIGAARRGVKVRIIADHMVSAQDPVMTAFLATVHPNLEVKHYRPALARLRPSKLRKALAAAASFHGTNQRMHNKLMVFDDAVMITGGRNIENTYFDHSTELNFRDRDVLAVGPVAREAAASFAQFWSYRHAVASRDLADVAAVIAAGSHPRYNARADYDFGGHFTALDREADDAALVAARFTSRLKPVNRVAFLADNPGKTAGFFSRTARITRELRRTLEQARRSIVMQTPYLVLSPAARGLFRELREKNPGLRVQVSSNSFASTDNLLAYSANYRLRGNYVDDLKLQVHEFKPRPAALTDIFPGYPLMAERAAELIKAGRQKRPPFLCLHAKSLVVDDRLAFVGSYNLDPRSENLNTEVGLLVEDEAFARELHEEIARDMRPENSWVIARRNIPLKLDVLNGLVDGILSLSPIDIWPIQNTSSFELRPGAAEVPPGDPAFYQNYRDTGPFPGADGALSNKEILTRLYKAIGAPLTPVL
ncbi:MAG: phospholipase D family protein [Opitutae bacterium]|nr:phospholipase D family protein [Opitutae bacterium]